MTNKQELRDAANAANIASWGRWESYHPHKGARGYEVKVGVKAIAQHCLKVDSVFIAAANPATVLALLDELEAAQSYAKERDEENQDLMLTIGRLRVEHETIESERDNALCELLPGVQYMDPPDGGCVTPMGQVRRMVADYRERIAELEANNDSATEALLKARRRAVTLPTGYSVRPGHPINETERGVMIPKDKGPWLSRHDVEHALRVAGIRINGEG